MQPELVLDAKAYLGEGPVWDGEALWWVDIVPGILHRFDPATGMDKSYEFREALGCVGLTKSGDLLLALADSGLVFFNPKTGRRIPFVHPEPDRPDTRFNDGKSDSMGCFLVGTMSYDAEQGAGNFYRIDPEGKIDLLATGMTIPNGMAWREDIATFYHVEGGRRAIDRMDYNIWTGEVSGRESYIEIPENLGAPDGLCIDAGGGLWVAQYGVSKVAHWHGRNGSLLETFELPVSQVTSCCFGGEDLSDLYITTARESLSEADLERQPMAGGLFRIRGVGPGTPEYRFDR